MSNEEIYETTGFDAISERLALLYPNQKERHYGTVIKYALGGKDPLDGISVYKSEKGILLNRVLYGIVAEKKKNVILDDIK